MGSFTKRYCFSANQDLEPDLQVLKVQGRLCKGLQKVFRSQKFQGVWIRFRGALQGVRVLLGSWIVLYRTGSGEVFGNGFGGDQWRAGL